MTSYESYNEGQLRTDLFVWQQNFQDIRREIDEILQIRHISERDERLDSATFRRDQAEREISLIENRLADLRRKELEEALRVAGASVRGKDASLDEAFGGWCRRNRIGREPEFHVRVWWDVDGRYFLGDFDRQTGELKVWAEVQVATAETVVREGRIFLPCNDVSEYSKVQHLG